MYSRRGGTPALGAGKMAVELKNVAQNGVTVKVVSIEKARLDDVVILALWYPVNQQVVDQLGRRLVGKMVVDIANPLNSTFDHKKHPEGFPSGYFLWLYNQYGL